jgi:hypothetical protein
LTRPDQHYVSRSTPTRTAPPPLGSAQTSSPRAPPGPISLPSMQVPKYPARWVISCSKVLAETVGTVVFLVEFICLRARCVENANRVCRAAPDAGLRMASRWNQPRNCATVRTVGLRCRCSPPGGPALHMHRRPPSLPLYSVRAGRFDS